MPMWFHSIITVNFVDWFRLAQLLANIFLHISIYQRLIYAQSYTAIMEEGKFLVHKWDRVKCSVPIESADMPNPGKILGLTWHNLKMTN
jgi:hypothetical protein